MRAREVIAQFVENQLQPNDMAGVMYPLWSITTCCWRATGRAAGAIRGFTGPEIRLHTAQSIRGELRPLRLDDRSRTHS